MSRRIVCPVLLVATALLARWSPADDRAPMSRLLETQAQPPEGQVADLREQLEGGLKARLPGEFLFIARVVGLVNKKQLPRNLVLAVFEKARFKEHPFQYFQRGLRVEARKRQLVVP